MLAPVAALAGFSLFGLSSNTVLVGFALLAAVVLVIHPSPRRRDASGELRDRPVDP